MQSEADVSASEKSQDSAEGDHETKDMNDQQNNPEQGGSIGLADREQDIVPQSNAYSPAVDKWALLPKMLAALLVSSVPSVLSGVLLLLPAANRSCSTMFLLIPIRGNPSSLGSMTPCRILGSRVLRLW